MPKNCEVLFYIILHLLHFFYGLGINVDKTLIFGIHFIPYQGFPLREQTGWGAPPSCPDFQKSCPFYQMPTPTKNMSLNLVLQVPTVFP